MHTENEAKQRWCPLARVPGKVQWGEPTSDPTVMRTIEGVCSQNRGMAMGGALDSCRCIASECMAWRWVNWHHEQEAAKKEPVGHCGLAGP